MKTIIIICIILILIGIIIWLWADKREKERKAKEEQEKQNNTPKEGFRAFIRLIKGLVKIGKVIGAVITRFKYVAKGIAKSGEGLGLAIKNIPIVAGLTVADAFMVGTETAKYGFRWTLCTIEKMKNLYFCILFYTLDLIISTIHMIVRSTFYFIDEFLGIQDRFGYGLVSLLDQAMEVGMQLDDAVYSSMGVHVLRYPEIIQDSCYRCKLPLNTDDVRRANRIMYNDLTTRITPLTDQFSRKFMQAGEQFAKVFEDI